MPCTTPRYVFEERKFTMFEVSVAGGKTGLAVYLGVCDCKVLIAADATAVPLVGVVLQDT
jgi:hypothetical protein